MLKKINKIIILCLLLGNKFISTGITSLRKFAEPSEIESLRSELKTVDDETLDNFVDFFHLDHIYHAFTLELISNKDEHNLNHYKKLLKFLEAILSNEVKIEKKRRAKV